MKKVLFFLLFTLPVLLPLQAQEPTGTLNFSTYVPLHCHGTIPEEILLNSREKYARAVKANQTRATTADIERQEYLLKSNYLLDQLMVSGKVLFGDTVTNYVNEVADRLLNASPSLRDKLHFYCLRTAQPQAFSTAQGAIFVSIGLLAQLETEAQLAFVLAREIAHYEQKHRPYISLSNDQVYARNERDRYENADDRMAIMGNYSQEQHREADKEGLILLNKAGYDCNAAVSALYVLQFAKLPFEERVFDLAFLERPGMRIPKTLLPDSVQRVNFSLSSDASGYSAQPDLPARRRSLELEVKTTTNCGNKQFGDTPERFAYMRKVCQFETVHYQLTTRNYCGALVNARLLQHTDSSSAYLSLCIGKALYGMSKYKTAGLLSAVVPTANKREGEQQRAYFLFNKLSAAQLNLIALRYVFDLNKQQPSEYLTSLVNDLADEAVNKHKVTYNELTPMVPSKTTPQTDTATAPTNSGQGGTGGAGNSNFVSKYDKLRDEQRKNEARLNTTVKTDNLTFYLGAFADIITEPAVAKLFDDAVARVEYVEQRRQREADRLARMSSYEQRRELQRQRQLKSTNAALGVNSVVVVDPFYFYADDRKGLKLMKSEDLRLKFCKSIEETAQEANLKVELLNPKSFTSKDVERYNDLAAINDWLSERIDHSSLNAIIPVESDVAIAVSQKYKAEHIYVTGVLTYKQPRENRGTVLLYTAIFYPLLPFGIAYALTPEHDTYYYSMVYNIGTGEERMKRVIHLHSNARNGFIVSQMFDTMLQIKNKPRKKGRS